MSHENLKILIADDDAVCVDWILDTLKGAGYDCESAKDSYETAQRIGEGSFDLLIADIRMPGNENLELIEQLKQSRRRIPTVLITAYPSADGAIRAVGYRVNSYLVKPFTPEHLLNTVRETARECLALRSLRGTLERNAAYNEHLENIAIGFQNNDCILLQQTASTFISLSMRNVIDSLGDIRNTIQVLAGTELADESARRLESSKPFMLISALQDAIRSIEKTKHQFKSKELADLRVRLQSLLDEFRSLPDAGQPPN